ncbi:MAG: DUF4199 domain-containing protein [Bacteroidota bacterium]
MNMDAQKPTLLHQGMKFGLILGFTQVVIYLLLYAIDKNLLVSFAVGGVMIVISIVLMVLPARNYKSLNGGSIDFKEAFLICLITFAGGALVTTVFNYVLYNLIDPSLSEFIKEKAIEKTVTLMEKFSSSQEDIEKAIAPLQEQDFSQSPARLGSQYISSVLFGAIPSLIIALIVRTKNKPLDEIQ